MPPHRRCTWAILIALLSADAVGGQQPAPLVEPKLEVVVQGHTNSVTSVSFSADGRFVATGSADNTAIPWDAGTGDKLQTFAGHTSLVSSVSLSGDGKRLATGSHDKTAILWDAATGAKLQTFAGHTSLVS